MDSEPKQLLIADGSAGAAPSFRYAQSYIDSVELNSLSYLKGEFIRYMQANCGSTFGPKTFETYDGRTKVRFTLHQPQPGAIDALLGSGCSVTGVQVALDFVTKTRSEAARMHTYLAEHVVQSLVPTKLTTEFQGTTYYDFERTEGPRKNVAIYSDLPSKPTPASPCAHLELRVAGAANLRKLQLREPAELLLLDHCSFWNDAVKLVQVPTADALAEQWLKFFMAQDRRTAKRFPYGGRTGAMKRIGELLRRAGFNAEGAVVANDLLVFLRQSRPLGRFPVARMFAEMDMQWMLPPPGNSLWK